MNLRHYIKGKPIEVREIRDEIEKKGKGTRGRNYNNYNYWKIKLDKNKKIFFAELIGTFILIVFATGSVVLDAKLNGALGLPFIAIAPAIAVLLEFIILVKHPWHISILQ